MPANEEQNQPDKGGNDFGAIDVAALMEQVRLDAPRGTVTVKGTVDAMRPSKYRSSMMYGDLRGFDEQSVLSFQCSTKGAPQPKDRVILRGTVTVRRSTWHRGYDLELVGERIGEWKPTESVAVHSIVLDKKFKLPLERFLSKGAVKRLVLIGTETAIKDAQTTLGQGSKQPFKTRVTMTGLEIMQAVIAEVAPKYDGLCLIRGGGPSNSFTTWHDPRLIATLIDCGKPFYTAIGHSTDVTLADVYADESFATPSALGSAFKDAWAAREDRQREQGKLENLERINRKLKAESEGAEQAGRDRSMAMLQSAIAELQRIPTTLGRLVSQSVSTAVRTSIQDDLSRPLVDAVQKPLTDLWQATQHAQSVMTKVARRSRWHTWTWLFSAFLSGVILGGVGSYCLGLSELRNMRDQLGTLQHQTAPPPPSAAPAPGADRKKLRSPRQAN